MHERRKSPGRGTCSITSMRVIYRCVSTENAKRGSGEKLTTWNCFCTPSLSSAPPNSSIVLLTYLSFAASFGSVLICFFATANTSLLGSAPITLSVLSNLAKLSARMPPPHPTSRYRKPLCSLTPVADIGSAPDEVIGEPWRRHDRRNCSRRGFIKCSSREDPCGSHQFAASASKCEISDGSTEDVECALPWGNRWRTWCFGGC